MILKEDYTTEFRDHGEITVPKGTKVTHRTAMGYDENYHFVDEFDWVEPWDATGTPKYGLIHDLRFYGLNVPKEYIE
jgi:hypothetical protein